MKTKLSNIFKAKSALVTIMSTVIPVKLSYHLAKVMNKLDSELKAIDKTNEEVIRKYGIEDATTKMLKIPEDKLAEANKEFDDFISQEVELDIWQIPLSKLIEGGIKLSTIQMMSLSDFIIDDTAPEVEKVA
jgi:hypothetical protein